MTRLPAYFGNYGGRFVPEILIPALEQLETAFIEAQADPQFRTEFQSLLDDYAGRPTPLTECRNLTQGTASRIFLKREDLLHGGAHKTNQVLGQGLLARRMGKTEVIAETGAGQHGVACALACALLGLKCRVYMGAKDVERQSPNVFRMKLLGATVIPVTSGSATLKDACNEALRDWSANYERAHYLLGTAAGPHPYPTMVREFQRMIGDESRAQILAKTGGLPQAVIACVGGGSNAIGMFAAFIADVTVELVGVEAAGDCLGETWRNVAGRAAGDLFWNEVAVDARRGGPSRGVTFTLCGARFSQCWSGARLSSGNGASSVCSRHR